MSALSFPRLLKGASLFAVLAAALLVARAVEPGAESCSRFVDEHIRAHGLTGVALYLGLTALLTCVGVPRQMLSLAGGYAFGALWGTAWATAGVTAGCVLSFSYARFLGQGFVQRRFGHRIAPLEKFLARSPLLMTFIIRSLPVGNNLVTNILAGVSRIPALPFFTGSCLGYIAQNFIFALLGSGARVDPFWRTAISAALFVLASLLGVWLYRRYRADVETMARPGRGE
ncbi:MAG: TVP38/TMEM64 family protein [Desulfovibrionaceae bacterium]|nr:TVP38/TMEM64 family protein [Desulfovibrionaceae bacterium]